MERTTRPPFNLKTNPSNTQKQQRNICVGSSTQNTRSDHVLRMITDAHRNRFDTLLLSVEIDITVTCKSASDADALCLLHTADFVDFCRCKITVSSLVLRTRLCVTEGRSGLSFSDKVILCYLNL